MPRFEAEPPSFKIQLNGKAEPYCTSGGKAAKRINSQDVCFRSLALLSPRLSVFNSDRDPDSDHRAVASPLDQAPIGRGSLANGLHLSNCRAGDAPVIREHLESDLSDR